MSSRKKSCSCDKAVPVEAEKRFVVLRRDDVFEDKLDEDEYLSGYEVVDEFGTLEDVKDAINDEIDDLVNDNDSESRNPVRYIIATYTNFIHVEFPKKMDVSVVDFNGNVIDTEV